MNEKCLFSLKENPFHSFVESLLINKNNIFESSSYTSSKSSLLLKEREEILGRSVYERK